MTKPSGYVEAIYTAREAKQPMQEQDMAMLLQGRGVAGDRYGENVGSFSARNDKIRHVSLIAIEAVWLANESMEQPYDPAETRRNILTSGIPDLRELVGVHFKIGEAVLRGDKVAGPCKFPEIYTGKPGFNDAYATREDSAYGGIRAEVLESGIIAVGNSIEVI